MLASSEGNKDDHSILPLLRLLLLDRRKPSLFLTFSFAFSSTSLFLKILVDRKQQQYPPVTPFIAPLLHHHVAPNFTTPFSHHLPLFPLSLSLTIPTPNTPRNLPFTAKNTTSTHNIPYHTQQKKTNEQKKTTTNSSVTYIALSLIDPNFHFFPIHAFSSLFFFTLSQLLPD